MTEARLQVQTEVLFVLPPGARAQADLPDQPEVEVLTHALPAGIHVRPLLDPVEQIDQRRLRLALGGEPSLALPAAAPPCPATSSAWKYQVPWFFARSRGQLAPSGLPAASTQPQRLNVGPFTAVPLALPDVLPLGWDMHLKLGALCGQAEQLAERCGGTRIRLPSRSTGVGQHPLRTIS